MACLVIRGGSKGTTLKDLYKSEVILAGRKMSLLGRRLQGATYQVIQQLAKEQGLWGRFTVGLYTKEDADILAQPSSRLMTSLQGVKFEVVGQLNIEESLLDALCDHAWNTAVKQLAEQAYLTIDSKLSRGCLVWTVNIADANPLVKRYSGSRMLKRLVYNDTRDLVKLYKERNLRQSIADNMTWFA